MIKVSIIIPVYNQKDLIVRALDSVPIRDDIEVIVCDDCSTDGTYEVLRNYSRLPLKLFRNEINRGAGYSRNVCFDNCSGEYIFGLDSDDMLITNKWEYVVDNFLDGIDFVRISRLENDGRVSSGGFAFHTYFLKRSVLGNVRCPEENYAEDYDVFLKIAPGASERKTNIVAYRYNYPRENSLSWMFSKGVSND